jgi:hypothetical protein
VRRNQVSAGALLLALVLLALLPSALDRAAVPLGGVGSRTAGNFPARGIAPASVPFTTKEEKAAALTDEFTPRDGLPYWSSWNPGGASVGELVLGPFPAPAILGLKVVGFPRVAGNRLVLENCVTGETRDLAETNVGFRWADLRFRTPPSWRGRPVMVHAVDGSSGPYGWLGVGALRTVPESAGWWTLTVQRGYALLGTGILYFLLLGPALRLAGRVCGPVSPFLLLVGLAVVAGAGYAVFWVMLANVPAGRGLVGLVLLLVFLEWVLVARREPRLQAFAPANVRIPGLLVVAVGLTYFGLLFLFQTDRPMHDVAARRYIRELAGDNQVSEMLADHLIRGEDPRNVIYGWWASSQRPPLESACDLIVAYPFSLTGIDLETAAQATGIWLQLAWVAAAWAWLRSLRFSPRAAAAVIACLVPTGFLAVNTVYIWPKLMAGAFLIGSFSLLFLEAEIPGSRQRRFAIAGYLLGVGILGHSGVGFSVLAMLLLAPLIRPFPTVRNGLALAAAAAALLLPWSAYQAYFRPPGNFLTTSNFGGARTNDHRSLLATMASNYTKQPISTTLQVRVVNLRTLVSGPWSQWLFPVHAEAVARREAEFASTFFALGWWNLGWLFLFRDAWGWGRRRDRDRFRVGVLQGAFWCLLALAIWVALMFFPGETKIHQGSYACMLTLFLCLAGRLLKANAWLFAGVVAAEIANYVLVWLSAVSPEESAVNGLGLGLTLLGAAALVLIVVRADSGRVRLERDGL